MKTDEISEGARQLRNEYQRQWRRKNPDKMKRYGIAYWQRLYEQKQTPEPARQKTAGQLELIIPR